jgi:hypothetical protein
MGVGMEGERGLLLDKQIEYLIRQYKFNEYKSLTMARLLSPSLLDVAEGKHRQHKDNHLNQSRSLDFPNEGSIMYANGTRTSTL